MIRWSVIFLAIAPSVTANIDIGYNKEVISISSGYCMAAYRGKNYYGWGLGKFDRPDESIKAVVDAKKSAFEMCNKATTECKFSFFACNFEQ